MAIKMTDGVLAFCLMAISQAGCGAARDYMPSECQTGCAAKAANCAASSAACFQSCQPRQKQAAAKP